MLGTSKVKIIEVWQNTGGCDGKGNGALLEITLDNGSYFAFSLDSKISDPPFAEILLGTYRNEPKTDGSSVYWDNGASLSFKQMLTMMQAERKLN